MANSHRSPGQPGGSVYHVRPMLGATDVVWALQGHNRRPESDYVKAVLMSYIDVKVARGRPNNAIHRKLEILELEMPQYAKEFHAVRARASLPPSRIFPPLQTSTPTPNTLARANTSQAAPRPSHTNTRTRTTAAPSNPARPVPVEEGELPPPPYASQDPEPDSTRLLQVRLAGEADSSGRLEADRPQPVAPEVYAPPPTSPPHSTRRARPARQPSPAASPAPPSRPPDLSSPGPSRRPPSPAPTSPPSDEEVAKVWEESQFDEAKRASLAAERERQELEQVMRLSLVESESRNGHSGAGPGEHGMLETFEDEDGPSSRRVSSYAAPTVALGTQHRRVASDAGAGGGPPGGWPTKQVERQSLMDDQDLISSHPPLTPSKTGAVLQSKNPFLSPLEHENESTGPSGSSPLTGMESPTTTTGQTMTHSSRTNYLSPSSSASRQASNTSLRGGPGSVATSPLAQPRHKLPKTPDRVVEPASGPPPQASRIQSSGASDIPPALPPRVRPSSSDAHPRVGTSTGSTPLPQLAAPPNDRRASPSGSGEDPLRILRGFDTVFLVDDSASMAGERWDQARQAIMGVAETAATYAENGVDVHFINSKRLGKELRTTIDVEDLFSGLIPRGNTPIGSRLEIILRDYLSRLERSVLSSTLAENDLSRETVKPMNLIVITDGVSLRMQAITDDLTLDRVDSVNSAPTDDPKSVLIAVAKRLDRGTFPLFQIGIQFLQIGDDVEAREALQELDDGLAEAHGVRDMVDTVPFTGEAMSSGLILKTLLGGIDRRLDRRSAG